MSSPDAGSLGQGEIETRAKLNAKKNKFINRVIALKYLSVRLPYLFYS